MKKKIRLIFFLFMFLTILVSGCTPVSTPIPPTFTASPMPPTTVPGFAQPTPEFTPANTEPFQPTATMLVTSTLTVSPLSADATCQPAEIDQYLNVVLPLADEHTVDTYEAQKMEALTDESHIVVLRDRATVRLETIRGFQAPPCLLEAHEKMTGSFELLISTWDLIEAKDYSTATTTLKKCYEVLAEAVAMIAIVQQE